MNVPLGVAGLAALVCTAAFVGHQQGWLPAPGLDTLELLALDARFRLRGPEPPSTHEITIVGIDERTRREAPELFQTRRGQATLIDALARYKPHAVGLDLLFDAPEEVLPDDVVSSVIDARDALARYGQDRSTTTISADNPAALLARAYHALDAVIEETRGDEILAGAVKQAQGIYLGVLFHVGTRRNIATTPGANEPPELVGARYGEWVATPGPASQRPPLARAITTSLPAIAAGAAGAGAVNVVPDSDGSIRRVYGVIEHDGRYYMPLGMAMALTVLEGGASYVAGATTIHAGNHELPCTARGELLLGFLGPQKTFRHVSAADVLAGRAPRDSLAGKLVLVGFTDVARDKVETPFDARLDGIEVHATLIHDLLHDQLMQRASPLVTLAMIALLGLAVTVLQARRLRRWRWWLSSSTVFLSIVAYAMAAQWLFSAHHVVVDVAAPVASGVIVALAALLAALATEGREKAELRAAFSQYVSASLVERLLADPGQVRLGGTRRELTVLFSDIRGFASLAEKLEPEVLSGFLNEYLTPMTEVVMEEGGMLDKYIGDAVMAVYGAPLDMHDHADRACRTALAMLDALEALNQGWRDRDLPVIAIGIGLNTGPMSVGNMGSQARFDYTVLGDAVNLGARLESLTKVYQVNILAGEDTVADVVDRYVFRELDQVRVKGRTGTVRVYELVGKKGQVHLDDSALERYASALAAYRARDWDGAEAGFTAFLVEHAKDGPARVMIERIRALRAQPPDDHWDGVFEQVTK